MFLKNTRTTASNDGFEGRFVKVKCSQCLARLQILSLHLAEFATLLLDDGEGGNETYFLFNGCRAECPPSFAARGIWYTAVRGYISEKL